MLTRTLLKPKFQRIAAMSAHELARELVNLEATAEGRTSFYRQCVGRELDNRFGLTTSCLTVQ